MSDSLTFHGRATSASPERKITIATDAAVDQTKVAMGYLTSHGHYGLSVHPYPDTLSGTARTDVAELRAVMFALNEVFDEESRPPVRLLTDSRDALSYLTEWRQGGDRMPPGYDTALRSGGTPSTLVILSRKMRRHQMITARLLKGHAGHPLNETADSLAKLGLRTTRGWNGARQARGLASAWARRGHAEYLAGLGCSGSA